MHVIYNVYPNLTSDPLLPLRACGSVQLSLGKIETSLNPRYHSTLCAGVSDVVWPRDFLACLRLNCGLPPLAPRIRYVRMIRSMDYVFCMCSTAFPLCVVLDICVFAHPLFWHQQKS